MDSQCGKVGWGGGGRDGMGGGIIYWESKEFAWLVVIAYQSIVLRIYTFFSASFFGSLFVMTRRQLQLPFISIPSPSPCSLSFSFSHLVFSFSFWLSLISYARQAAEPSHCLGFGVPQNSCKSNKFMLCHAQKRITDSWLYVIHTTADILYACVEFLFRLRYPVSGQWKSEQNLERMWVAAASIRIL